MVLSNIGVIYTSVTLIPNKLLHQTQRKKLWRERKWALERLDVDGDGKAFGDAAAHEQKNPTLSGGRADFFGGWGGHYSWNILCCSTFTLHTSGCLDCGNLCCQKFFHFCLFTNIDSSILFLQI